MNGFELREKIKETRPDLPVFMLTGRHEASDRQRAEANGVAGFFHKPFDGQDLLRAVERAVG
jgi:FixJ family two-component response regulator